METIETMEQLSAKSKQVSLYNVLSGRIWDNEKREWTAYLIHPDLKSEICKIIGSNLQGRKYNYGEMLAFVTWNKYRHPIMKRFILSTYDNKTRWEYIAGQDYNAEIATFRKWLRSTY